jgi:hypothetical protein
MSVMGSVVARRLFLAANQSPATKFAKNSSSLDNMVALDDPPEQIRPALDKGGSANETHHTVDPGGSAANVDAG